MKCLICNAEAPSQLRPGLWIETRCVAGCGHFRISAELMGRLFSSKSGFDISRTRAWLEQARVNYSVPQISGYDYSVSLLGNS